MSEYYVQHKKQMPWFPDQNNNQSNTNTNTNQTKNSNNNNNNSMAIDIVTTKKEPIISITTPPKSTISQTQTTPPNQQTQPQQPKPIPAKVSITKPQLPPLSNSALLPKPKPVVKSTTTIYLDDLPDLVKIEPDLIPLPPPQIVFQIQQQPPPALQNNVFPTNVQTISTTPEKTTTNNTATTTIIMPSQPSLLELQIQSLPYLPPVQMSKLIRGNVIEISNREIISQFKDVLRTQFSQSANTNQTTEKGYMFCK